MAQNRKKRRAFYLSEQKKMEDKLQEVNEQKELEEKGVVGPADGAKPRAIMMTLDVFKSSFEEPKLLSSTIIFEGRLASFG